MPFTIRAMTEDDLPATVAIRNLPRARWGTLSMPFESLERWRKYRAANPKPQDRFLVACAGDIVVGLAGLHLNTLPRRAHAAGIGINVHDDWSGRGVGTALFTALIDLADNWLGLRRLELAVYTDNAPAIALYSKFGFVAEGVERCDAFRDGVFVDSQIMARLRGDLPPDLSPYPPAAVPAPPAPFTLRGVEPQDLPAITEMMNQPLVRHGTLRTPFCTPAEIAHLACPPDPATRAIVAQVRGQAVGLIMLSPGKARTGHSAEITLLAVHDAYAGRGIGPALLGAMLDLADNWLNTKRLSLTVFADNHAAIALYRKAGFHAEASKQADAFRNGGFADAMVMGRVR